MLVIVAVTSPVAANRHHEIDTPAERQRSYQSSVATEADGATIGPAFTPRQRQHHRRQQHGCRVEVEDRGHQRREPTQRPNSTG